MEDYAIEERTSMALTKFGFIVTGKGLQSKTHRMEMQSQTFTMIAVGVASPEQAVSVARELVAEGIQLLELCGGFGPIWTSRIIEAIANQIPVGSVGYGPESIGAMHALFK
jgi:hypothetical protein